MSKAQKYKIPHKYLSKYSVRKTISKRYRYKIIGGKSFGRYNTLEEAKQVAERERRNIFPLSSELDNKITL